MTLLSELVGPGIRGEQSLITDQQWWIYQQQGWLSLGELLSADDLAALRSRVDDLALGRVTNAEVEFQRDTGGRYEDLPVATRTFSAGTLLHFRPTAGG